MRKSIPLFILYAFLFPSCLNKPVKEAVPVLETDVREISVAGAFSAASDDNKVAIKVTCNRNWYARLSKDFAELSQSEAYDFDGVSRATDLLVTFKENPYNVNREDVLEIFSEERNCISIPIVQYGITYELSAAANKTSVDSDGETVTISVDCNTGWKAELSEDNQMILELDKTEGVGEGVINVKVPESMIQESRTASVVISAEACEDVRIVFTQAGSTKKVFNPIKTTFIPGGTGAGIVPLLVIDKEALGEEASGAGPEFHYTTGSGGFDELATPTEASPELTDAGLALLPEGYQTATASTGKYYEFYVKILACAEGYRNSYTKVMVRVWSFGQKYIYNQSAVNGLTLSGAAGGKSTYYIRFAEANKSTMTVSAQSLMSGNGRVLFKYHTTANDTNVEVKVGDNSVYNRNVTGIPATDPELMMTSNFDLEAGQTIALSSLGPEFSFLWSLLVMEECKYIP